MTRYCSVLLLFLLLHLTACQAWQSVSLDAISPDQLIEEDRPDRVRVTMPDGTQVELENPSVEGDELVGYAGGYERVGGRLIQTGSVPVPLADILMLEIRNFSLGRTVLLVLGGFGALPLVCLGGGCMGG